MAVNGEQLAVSSAILSRKFGISPDQARQLLTDFSSQNADSVKVTYCLRGKKSGITTIELVDGAELATKSSAFSEPLQTLIYSVSASPMSESVLYNMGTEAQALPNKFAIVSPYARDIPQTERTVLIKESPPPASSPAVKAKETKTETKTEEKKTDTKTSKPAPAAAPPKTEIRSKAKPAKLDFFAGQKKKDAERAEKKAQAKAEGKDEDVEMKDADSKAPETKSKPAPQSAKPVKLVKPAKTAAQIKKEKELEEALFNDDVVVEKRKPTVSEEPKDDSLKEEDQKSDEGKETQDNEVEMEDVEEETQEDVEMEDDLPPPSQAPPQSQTARRGKKRVIKRVQELDEDGYMTYKKVESWESCDEAEDESGMNDPKKELKPAKKEVKKETKKDETPKKSNNKKGAAGKQSSLMSFFKK